MNKQEDIGEIKFERIDPTASNLPPYKKMTLKEIKERYPEQSKTI
jgi:hypothetical protein